MHTVNDGPFALSRYSHRMCAEERMGRRGLTYYVLSIVAARVTSRLTDARMVDYISVTKGPVLRDTYRRNHGAGGAVSDTSSSTKASPDW